MAAVDIPSPEVSGKTTHKKSILPAEALAQHIGILGKTGSGKTTTAKGLAEGLLSSGKRLCALGDPTGVWWGLRLMADGLARAIHQLSSSVAVMPTWQSTTPLAPGSRRLSLPGSSLQSLISLDDDGWPRTQFFTDFAEALVLGKFKSLLHLIIDEAHIFAPQGRVPDPQSGRMVHAANNLVSGGRSRGLRIMLISQRPAKSA